MQQSHKNRTNRKTKAKPGWYVLPMIALGLLAAGCDTNLNEILFESGAATGRTALDLWITEFENRLATALDQSS